MNHHLALWLPVLLLALAPAVAPLRKVLGSATGWVLGGVLAAACALYALLPLGLDGEVLRIAWSWIPSLGISLALRYDGLAAVFALLVTGIGATVLVYAEGYMAGHPRIGRLQGTLVAFLGAMLGLVLADDLISFFVFWELTSVTSYLLIGTTHEKPEARVAGLRALLITGAGGLALLGGLLVLRHAALQRGLPVELSWVLSEVITVDLAGHALVPVAIALLALGAFTKSAQVPFHGWLPAAMAAPTPVSALLHSATMVKAGVFLLARLSPLLAATPTWRWTLVSVGCVTMLVAAAIALRQRDLKLLLAYSTVSVLGTLTMLLGVGTELAVKAAVVFLAAHALYKAALFMVAGNIDHETGTRDVRLLGGLRRLMPWTAAAGLAAALSKAGAPPFFGFVGKELVYKAKLGLDGEMGWVLLVAVLTNIALVAVAIKVAVRPFFGARGPMPKTPHEAPLSMLVGPLALAGLSLFVGLLPALFDTTYGPAMASSILGRPIAMDLALWHGLSPAALLLAALSLATLGLGALLYRWVRPPRAGSAAELPPAAEAQARRDPWRALVRGFLAFTTRATRALQGGKLPRYIAWTATAGFALVLPFLVPAVRQSSLRWDAPISGVDLLLALLVVGGGWGAALARDRLAAVAALGVCGLGLALLFALYSAPDLALTQIMVEALLVVLLVLLLRRLPTVRPLGSVTRRGAAMLVALTGGVVMAGLTLAASATTLPGEASRFFAEASVPMAKGQNVVNVILVDFRALDTLGEIAVVAGAAIGVVALLRGLRRDGAAE